MKSLKIQIICQLFEMMLEKGVDDEFLGELAEQQTAGDRLEVIYQYCFVLPFSWLLKQLANQCDQYLSVGAGSGYFEALLAQYGVEILATDKYLPGEEHAHYPKAYFPITKSLAQDVVGQYPDRTVLCIYPTYEAEWPTEMLKRMAAGQRLIFLGSFEYCASPSFKEMLDREFWEVDWWRIDSWWACSDYLAIYEKKADEWAGGRCG